MTYGSLMMDYGELLDPGKGFGDCSFSAKSPLGHIYNEIGNHERPYQLAKLMRFKAALENRLRMLDENAEEALILRFMVGYLSVIREFLGPDDLEDDAFALRHAISSFEALRPLVERMKWPSRDELVERLDIAVNWCKHHAR